MARALPGKWSQVPVQGQRPNSRPWLPLVLCGLELVPGERALKGRLSGRAVLTAGTVARGRREAAGAGGRVAGCLQVQQGTRQSTAGQCGWRRFSQGRGQRHLRHTHPLVRPSPTRPRPGTGRRLPPSPGSRSVPGSWPEYTGSPSSQPLGSLGAWMGHSHWPCPSPPACPPRSSQTRESDSIVWACQGQRCGGRECAPLPKRCLQTHVCKHKTSLEKEKNKEGLLAVQWLSSAAA